MVSFELNEELRLIRDSVREFARNEILPHVREWDEHEIFPIELFQKMGDMGFLGIMVPEKYGGSGYGYQEKVIIIEELAKVDPGIALGVAAHNSLCTGHILMFGTEEQKLKYLPDLASGKHMGAWGLTEPSAGSDAGALETTAERKKNGYVLNGTKVFTTHGSLAGVYVILAKTDRTAGKKGITAFIIERGTPGLIPGKREEKLGMRTSDTASVILEECFVPEENIVGGEPGQGFSQVLEVLNGGRVGIGALALGLAEGAFESALHYAKERTQFGRPLIDFQSISFMLADMATQIEAARLLVYRSAWLRDQGKPAVKEASMAKLFASEVAVRVAEQALQLYGGYGFVKDYPVEKYYRDVKLTTIGEGTSQIQRIVIARQLLKEIGFRPPR